MREQVNKLIYSENITLLRNKNINKAARMKLENTRLRKRSHCKRVQTTWAHLRESLEQIKLMYSGRKWNSCCLGPGVEVVLEESENVAGEIVRSRKRKKQTPIFPQLPTCVLLMLGKEESHKYKTGSKF